ncbi:MAG: hypothetical protein Q7S53_00380 [bacterium]|nr:hypothetical protein [bacterium]
MADNTKSNKKGKPDWSGWASWYKKGLKPSVIIPIVILVVICYKPQPGAVFWNLVRISVFYAIWRLVVKPAWIHLIKPRFSSDSNEEDNDEKKAAEKNQAALDPKYFGDDEARREALRRHPLP